MMLARPALTLAAQPTYHSLHSFGLTHLMGQNPAGSLLLGSDGLLYGTAEHGGTSGMGIIFQTDKAGSQFLILHHFGSLTHDGRHPRTGVIEVGDTLYGTAHEGGTNGGGIVFRIDRDGTGYTVLHAFPDLPGDGANPHAPLLLASDGILYGTTESGGTASDGTLYKLSTNGTGYAVLRSFGASSQDGINPKGHLLEGQDGLLYGTTFGGGQHSLGSLFRLTKAGGSYGILHSFAGEESADGSAPTSGVIEGADDALYGTTSSGGTDDAGTVFRIGRNGSPYTLLRSFRTDQADGQDGQYPAASLVQGPDGFLYGTTEFGGSADAGTLFKLGTNGADYVVLQNCGAGPGDARHPRTALVQDSDQLLYGASYYGGSANSGSLFRLNQDGSDYQVTRSLLRGGGDSLNPATTLMSGQAGFLYGTSYYGGAADVGTLFKLNPDGAGHTLLKSFGSVDQDGQYPAGSLVATDDATLYGITQAGGSANLGTVFRISPAGSGYEVVWSFGLSAMDGQTPKASLLAGSDGALYGTTERGGAQDAGTIFKLDQDGTDYTVLKSFGAMAGDGTNAVAALVETPGGRLLCSTRVGGSFGLGALFALDANGDNYQVLRSFQGRPNDGKNPAAALLVGADGWVYGTTELGGRNDFGCIFRLRPDGSEHTLIRSFGLPLGDGRKPVAALVEGPDGMLYGTTSQGGAHNHGTIFRLLGNGSGYGVLWHFGGTAADGRSPLSPLFATPQGDMFATTFAGGQLGYGTVYRLRFPSVGLLFNVSGDAASFRFQFQSIENLLYIPQFKPSPSDPTWTSLPNLLGTGSAVTVEITNPPPAAIYRVTLP